MSSLERIHKYEQTFQQQQTVSADASAFRRLVLAGLNEIPKQEETALPKVDGLAMDNYLRSRLNRIDVN